MANRTLQTKRWKHQANRNRNALGGYAKLHTASTLPTDETPINRRDGGYYKTHAPRNSMPEIFTTENVTSATRNNANVSVVKSGKADGLEKDYSNRGKGGNHACKKTFGDGTRRAMGIGYNQFASIDRQWKLYATK